MATAGASGLAGGAYAVKSDGSDKKISYEVDGIFYEAKRNTGNRVPWPPGTTRDTYTVTGSDGTRQAFVFQSGFFVDDGLQGEYGRHVNGKPRGKNLLAGLTGVPRDLAEADAHTRRESIDGKISDAAKIEYETGQAATVNKLVGPNAPLENVPPDITINDPDGPKYNFTRNNQGDLEWQPATSATSTSQGTSNLTTNASQAIQDLTTNAPQTTEDLTTMVEVGGPAAPFMGTTVGELPSGSIVTIDGSVVTIQLPPVGNDLESSTAATSTAPYAAPK